jgi:hypothetical protein
MTTVPCPECEAPAGEGCRGARPERNGQPYRRVSVHMLRATAFSVANHITSSRELFAVLAEHPLVADSRQHER